MALHEQSVGASDEWYTPPEVFRAMGATFDLDVSSPGQSVTPWIPARRFILEGDLEARWEGFVWMNAPFGGRNGLWPWLAEFFSHYDGVALVPDRTSAPWWQTFARKADAVLFVGRKLKFLTPDPVLGSRRNRDGSRTPCPSPDFPGLYVGSQPAQGTCLFAAGERGVRALQRARQAGLGLLLETPPEDLGQPSPLSGGSSPTAEKGEG